jgi:hypothetical protein
MHPQSQENRISGIIKNLYFFINFHPIFYKNRAKQGNFLKLQQTKFFYFFAGFVLYLNHCAISLELASAIGLPSDCHWTAIPLSP